jgi:Fe-S-cluster containining protein
MLTIKCAGCANSCCGKNPHLTPVLLPSEERKFKKYSRKIKTAKRDMFVLAKKENGNCVFLDEKTNRCSVYSKRPLECKIYPFLLDFDGTEASVKLDERFCPSLKTMKADEKKLIGFVRLHKFPPDWMEGYGILEDF